MPSRSQLARMQRWVPVGLLAASIATLVLLWPWSPVGAVVAGAGEVGLVLEIGASSSVISLVRGERVLMARNIGVSADDFTTALQKAFDLDFGAAEEVKLGYATATTPTEDEEDLLNFDLAREQYSPARVFEVVRPVAFQEGEGDILLVGETILAGHGFRSSLESHREIAEILGLTETNVATRIGRLKQRLRDRMCPKEG